MLFVPSWGGGGAISNKNLELATEGVEALNTSLLRFLNEVGHIQRFIAFSLTLPQLP
jgi:hypothetical protein